MDVNITAVPPFDAFTDYTPVIPKLYWDVYSAEQRIKELCMTLDKLINYSELIADNTNALQEEFNSEFAALKKNLHDQLAQLNAELRELIANLEAGQLQWDCQHGAYADTVEAQRDMFNDVTVHALEINDLNALEMDVDALADCGLNVRGVAVYSGILKDECPFVPSGIIYNQMPVPGSMLTCEQLSRGVVENKFFKEA